MIRKLLDKSLVAVRSEDGVTALEYGILAGVVSIVIVVAAIAIGPNLTTLMGRVETSMSTAAGA